QYKFAINYDLGFAAENVLNLELKGNDADLFIAEIEKLPEVSMISKSGMIPSTGEIWGEDLKYNDPMDSVSIFVNWVDKNYTEVHELKFLAGGTFPFDLKDEEDPKYIIFDRNLSERFGFNNPEDAVGEVITILRSRSEDLKVQVSGVIENYRYADLMSDTEPTALIQSNGENILNLNMVVSTSDPVSLMSKLEAIWTEVDKVHPFEASFLDQQVEGMYAHYASVFKIFGFLAFLAISISTMGLLGMAVFTTETRIKEISIRKVLGASEKNLVLVLSRSFVYMLLISGLIAIPFTYFVFSSFVLEEFTQRIPIGFMELAPGALLIIAIGFLTIGWQTLKAAKTNPADMLRDE
ncbi:MAG: FtsX-like permease family protein, partial [Bacteroidota bacterium]